nr:DNA replication licensing factor MCM5 [Hymenolepis microstoma]CUU99801.1 DNA replication licensing factor MCM5 [Hymenolepis microstoma]
MIVHIDHQNKKTRYASQFGYKTVKKVPAGPEEMQRRLPEPRLGAHERVDVGVLHSYIQALGLRLNIERKDRSGVFSAGRLLNAFKITTKLEEEVMRKLANAPNIYELIARSIAPSICDSLNIKRAIACLLFGGSRKQFAQRGTKRRGQANNPTRQPVPSIGGRRNPGTKGVGGAVESVYLIPPFTPMDSSLIRNMDSHLVGGQRSTASHFVFYVKDGQTSLTDVIVNMVSGGFYLILNFGLVLKKSAPI